MDSMGCSFNRQLIFYEDERDERGRVEVRGKGEIRTRMGLDENT